MRRALFGVISLLAVSPAALSAQSWRTFDVSRQLRDSTPLAVHVTYGAGRVTVQADQQRNLFGVHLRYDTERAEPVYRFDAAARQLNIGVRHPKHLRNAKGGEGGELRVHLARATPLKLQLDVGAAEGDFDLSGLQVDELSLQTGATDSHIRFDVPNPRRMRLLRVDMGAASVDMKGLGNANAERIDVNLGVGHLEMDFSGEWRTDVAMTVNSALGDVTITVPDQVAIRVETSTFLHSFNSQGLTKVDGAWVSPNWSTARYKLQLRSTGALGNLTIKRVAS